MSGKETSGGTSDKWDIENATGDDNSFNSASGEQKGGFYDNKPFEALSFLLQPFAIINETKDVLQKLATVHIVEKRMSFSDDEFERRYIDFLEPKIRYRMFLLGVGAVLCGLYSMFFYSFLGANSKISPLIFSWHSHANAVFNTAWASVVLIGLFIAFVSLKKNVFVHSVEKFLQYSTAIMMVAGTLCGNLWRASRMTGVNFFDAFPGLTDMYPDSGLVMLLGAVILYLAVVIDMRFRRLLWICIITLLMYTFSVVYFKLPDFRNLLLSNQTANAPPPYLREEGRHNPVVRALYAAAARERFVKDEFGATTIYNDVPVMQDSVQTWVLALQLLMLYTIALFGKVQLELLQRQNFLELDLAGKRIQVLENTITAIGSKDNQPHSQLERTHQRLKNAERIVEKVRLMSMSSRESVELETVLQVLRETEKTMAILDFQKEILIGPIKTGVEYKEAEVLQWIRNTVASDEPADNTLVAAVGPNHLHALEGDLGISAKSLMKRIGVEWSLDLNELEMTLKSNGASDMNAFCLTARAVLTPFLSNVLLGTTPENLANFARTVNNAYLDVPYHNAEHAAAVCHHSMVLLDLTGVKRHVGGLDRLALAIASLCHKVSHFGRSNGFLIESRHELALRYNDQSVMENFHASKTFEIIKSCKLTASLSKRDEKRFRNRVIQIILSGDSANHFSLFGEFKLRLINDTHMFQDPELLEADRRIGLIACFKTANYGAYAMPTDVANTWVARLAEELAQQGDDERALGLPISPICDRATQDLASMTMGLMQLVVMPLFDEVFNLVKQKNPGPAEALMGSICSALINNHSHWATSRKRNDEEIFIPIPKERTVTASSGSHTLESLPRSPPSLVPVDGPVDLQNITSPADPRGQTELTLSFILEDSDDEGPPMLPFNAAFKR